MKPREKMVLLTLFVGCWIGLWWTGPEEPGTKSETWELAVFATVLVVCFVQYVRFSAQQLRERDAERLKKVLKRRDARTHR